jgi:hypothetical protein
VTIPRATRTRVHGGYVIPVAFAHCAASDPRKQQGSSFFQPLNGHVPEPDTGNVSLFPSVDADSTDISQRQDWTETVEAEVIRSLPDSEINRQTYTHPQPIVQCFELTCSHRIIHKLISKEEQYVQDLDTVETVSRQVGTRANVLIVHQSASFDPSGWRIHL